MSKNWISTENKFVSGSDFIRANELSSSTLPELGEKIIAREKEIKELEKAAKNAKTYIAERQIRMHKIALEIRKMKIEKIRAEFERELIGLLVRLERLDQT